MSKPQQRIIKTLLKLNFNVIHNQTQISSSIAKPSIHHNVRMFSTNLSNGFANSAAKSSKTLLNPGFPSSISRPISSNGVLCPKIGYFKSFLGVYCRNYSAANAKLNGISANTLGFKKLVFNPLNIRQFSTKISGFGNAGKLNKNAAKKVVEKPLSAISSTFSRYKSVIGLQIEGFWKRNFLFMMGAGGVFVCIVLWRIMFGIANTFVGLSEGMAKYGFLALSSAMVAFAGLYLRSRYNINPDKVYRMAMKELNTSASILEVLGAPLAGTDLRAYVMSGGGLTMSKLKPRLRSKRCFLIFPIRGSERKGLVSVQVKKKEGKYNVKLLAVDIPMASGPDQRLFLIGDEEEYRIGGGLIGELRDPVVRAMAASKELEERDDIEAEEDEERELQEAERKHQEQVEKLERDRTR
ncbi:uncharacterized protein LOC110717838 [Chenopodium quinoa]|uniref:Import inner membrane translocase subunit n=1 Tax=Chenopodium quinoa TaxID=63459 RepID=A0A803MMP5_CHEQI|nr:uncharacterized protein LOC110717838 [Chenopodium quinoa]